MRYIEPRVVPAPPPKAVDPFKPIKTTAPEEIPATPVAPASVRVPIFVNSMKRVAVASGKVADVSPPTVATKTNPAEIVEPAGS